MRHLLTLPTLPLLLSLSALSACGTTDENNDENNQGPPPLTCAEVNRAQVGQDIPTGANLEATLEGVYSVSGRLIFDSSEKITIKPGTIFLMEPDSKIYFGWRSDPATVYAQGTAEAPILFCGTKGEPGHWVDLQLLTGTTSDSTFEHVRIEDGGKGDVPVLLQSVELRHKHLTITNNKGVGLDASALKEGSEDFTITANGAHPLRLKGGATITNLPEGKYDGNAQDHILVNNFEGSNVTFHNRGIPYLQERTQERFGKAGGPQLDVIFEAGVEYRFCQDCLMEIGWRGDPAKIEVRGEAAAPVTFTSHRTDAAQPGDWKGLGLLTGSTSDSFIRHANFLYGGVNDPKSGALIVAGGRGDVTDCSFSKSAGFGMYLDPADTGFSQSNNTFEGNALGDIGTPPQ